MPAAEAEAEAVEGNIIGPTSTGEAARLQARIGELENEVRRREIEIVGLKSEVAELKAERLAKSKAARAKDKRSEKLTDAIRAVMLAESPIAQQKALERLADKLKGRMSRYIKVIDSTPELAPAADKTSAAKPAGQEAAPTGAPKVVVH